MDTERFVVIDDTDPLIKYEGASWFLDDTGSQDAKGNFGPVYNKTLHGTIVSASLSFAFTGNKFKILGTNNVKNISGVLDPAWECFVDGIKVESRVFKYFENNWGLCGHEPLTLRDGPHIATLNVTVKGSEPFYFDKIHYTPSASADLDNKTVYVPATDPAVQFSGGWGSVGSSANATTHPDSFLMFDFYGVSVSWYGYIPKSTGDSTGTYSIDDSAPVPFTMKALPEGSTQYNMEYFRTPEYPKGPHKLTVSYLGGPSGAAPLLLDYFVVRNIALGESTNYNGTTVIVPGSNHNPQGGVDRGAIVGGVLGGLAMLLLATLIFVYIRRRLAHRRVDGSWPSASVDASSVEPAAMPLMSSVSGQILNSSSHPFVSTTFQPQISSKFVQQTQLYSAPRGIYSSPPPLFEADHATVHPLTATPGQPEMLSNNISKFRQHAGSQHVAGVSHGNAQHHLLS